MPDWQARATRLVADLIALGVLDDPRWVTAFRETPRHLFVPRWLRQEENGCWHPVAHDDPATAAEWAERTYTDAPLVTAVDATGAPISSSSQPSLMAQMLTALDVTDDARVLEIGIGTGYDAALLCHRLRDEQVHSIDVEPALTEIARERLAALAASLDEQEGEEQRRIGLRNVHQRLILMYGPSSGLRIESTSGAGTRVSFRLPAGGERQHVQSAGGG